MDELNQNSRLLITESIRDFSTLISRMVDIKDKLDPRFYDTMIEELKEDAAVLEWYIHKLATPRGDILSEMES
jgi:hypothetical protein